MDHEISDRPIATPELIAAAIPQQTGYGKLVVLSSNFAGKEFELSRPQMIIGRTDENDIVVNHRSISRNHAKVVREPDTGRYTISDLQSSNGVRVNGNDYSKVELRRGDVVDLGHVRLRFVEPGEDFLFSRDAVITDVPEAGGKKGLMVAVVLGILVLGGVLVFFLTRGPSNEGGNGSGTGSSGLVSPQPDAGPAGDDSQVAVAPVDATEAVTTPDAASVAVWTKSFEKPGWDACAPASCRTTSAYVVTSRRRRRADAFITAMRRISASASAATHASITTSTPWSRRAIEIRPGS